MGKIVEIYSPSAFSMAALDNLPGHRMRFDYSDGDPDQEANVTILQKTA